MSSSHITWQSETIKTPRARLACVDHASSVLPFCDCPQRGGGHFIINIPRVGFLFPLPLSVLQLTTSSIHISLGAFNGLLSHRTDTPPPPQTIHNYSTDLQPLLKLTLLKANPKSPLLIYPEIISFCDNLLTCLH